MTSDITTTIHQELKCLRTHIVDFIVYRLEHDLITQKRAAQLAQAVLDQLTDTLTHDQTHQVLEQLKIDFPELSGEIESASAACETIQARQALDDQILQQVTQGNITSALDLLNQFKVK